MTTITLSLSSDKKISDIKALREAVPGLGLKEAKDIADILYKSISARRELASRMASEINELVSAYMIRSGTSRFMACSQVAQQLRAAADKITVRGSVAADELL